MVDVGWRNGCWLDCLVPASRHTPYRIASVIQRTCMSSLPWHTCTSPRDPPWGRAACTRPHPQWEWSGKAGPSSIEHPRGGPNPPKVRRRLTLPLLPPVITNVARRNSIITLIIPARPSTNPANSVDCHSLQLGWSSSAH